MVFQAVGTVRVCNLASFEGGGFFIIIVIFFAFAISLPLREEAWALLRRLNSAKRSLELTAGAIESGELGLENSSGIFSCFSRLLRERQKAKGDVDRDTLMPTGV